MSAVLEVPTGRSQSPAGDHPHIDKDVLRGLMQPSLFQWGIRTAGDWLLCIVPMLIAGYTREWWAYALAVLGTGISQHRLALMAHEGSHRQATRNKFWNDLLVGFFTLWPFANPVGGYRRFHFNHHRYLNTEGDPELKHKRKSAPAWDLPSGWPKIVRCFLEDICLLHVNELVHLSQNARPGTSKIDRLLPIVLATYAATRTRELWPWPFAIFALGLAAAVAFHFARRDGRFLLWGVALLLGLLSLRAFWLEAIVPTHEDAFQVEHMVTVHDWLKIWPVRSNNSAPEPADPIS